MMELIRLNDFYDSIVILITAFIAGMATHSIYAHWRRKVVADKIEKEFIEYVKES